MNSIFTIIYIVWGVSELLINILLRAKSDGKPSKDKSSLGLIWLGVLGGLALAFFIAVKYEFLISNYTYIRTIGIVAIAIGIIFRLLSIFSLGKFFTSNVAIAQDHQLKTTGVYHFLRHPSYAASLLSFIGFGISLNNWVSLLIIVIVVGLVFRYRIKVEEKALIDNFGKEYLDYQKTTKAIIPFIY